MYYSYTITKHYNYFLCFISDHPSLPGAPSLQVEITDVSWGWGWPVLARPGETPLVSPLVSPPVTSRPSQSQSSLLQSGVPGGGGEAPQSEHNYSHCSQPLHQIRDQVRVLHEDITDIADTIV